MTKLEQAARIALNVLENKCDPKDEVVIALREALAEQRPHYTNTSNPVDFPSAKHQEELNKFAEDSVWDGENDGTP